MEKVSEFLKNLKLDEFKLENYLPKLDSLWGVVETLIRIAVMAGPLILLGLGLWYFLAPPREANHRVGFRTLWGMGSVEAWLFTQKVAGILFTVLGFVLTVVMAVICNGYRGMEYMAVVESAAKCLLWQLGLSVVAFLIAHMVPLFVFDWKGIPRKEKRRDRKLEK